MAKGKKDGFGPEEESGKRYFIGRNKMQKQKKRKPALNYGGKIAVHYDKS